MKFFHSFLKSFLLSCFAVFVGTAAAQSFQLQLLHGSDFEASIQAVVDAPHFAAIVDSLEGTYPNTLIVSSGDNILPSPFSNSGEDPSLVAPLKNTWQAYYGGPFANNDLRAGIARADISIMNFIGIEASVLGNHEFDWGTSELRNIIAGANSGTNIRWFGAQFPYLSANLNFSDDSNLSNLYESSIKPTTFFKSNPTQTASNIAATKKLASATVVNKNGELIGLVGATTPLLATISSPGATTVKNPGAGTNDMAALASIIQPVVDSLRFGMGINKIILLAHLQQLANEKQLATLLKGVDIIIAGGSHTILSDATDRLRAGDVSGGTYPFLTQDADGNPIAVVNTGSDYRYVGRLVVDFDSLGFIIPASIDPNVSGSYPTDSLGVVEVYGAGNYNNAFTTGSKASLVKVLCDAVNQVIINKDGNLFGSSDVYMEGRRNFVRTQETNFGNLTADANLWVAKQYDPTVSVSLKNGGGIRSSIGYINAVGFNAVPETTQANPIANKPKGAISQLDIENSLRFNNQLTLLTLSAANLRTIIEHGVAATAPGQTPGRFPQVSGIKFSYNPTLPANSRVRSAAIVDDNGTIIDTLVINGTLHGDPSRTFRIVTLNFLANGGDGYPFNTLGTARVDLNSVLTAPGQATFTNPGSEQDAFAEYMKAIYSVNPFNIADKPVALDERIQNLTARADCIFPSAEIPNNSMDDDCDGIVDDECAAPTQLKVVMRSPNSAWLTWATTFNTSGYEIRWGNVNTPISQWTTAVVQRPVFQVNNLSQTAIYGFQVRALCTNGTMTSYSDTRVFAPIQDVACGRPVLGSSFGLSPNSQFVFWNYEKDAERYRIRWAEAGVFNWSGAIISGTVPAHTIVGLKPATEYIYQVRARCGGSFKSFSIFGHFTTQSAGIQPFVANEQTEAAVLFPNPAESFLFARGVEPNTTIQIYGSTGMLAATFDGTNLIEGADISALPAGNYFAKIINTDGRIQTLQFTKAGK